ncbi:small heat shock protein [Agrocybe pediades]|nr:small heat shock protein [Agrocybe pediades]
MSNVLFYEPFYDFDRLFEAAFNARNSAANNGGNSQIQQSNGDGDGAVRLFKPRMDLHEDNEKNLVTATFELPGLAKDNIAIDVQNNRLTVAAESKQSSDFEENGYAVRERRFGKFSRTLQLPTGIKPEDIKANMENGLLTITFPKTTPEMQPKKIAIA